MFEELREINHRPKPFAVYTAAELWTNEHTAQKMLEYHLNESIDLASRNRQFIDQSVNWILSRFAVGSGTSIADFGCGPGLYTSRFAEKGATVTGIDFSLGSLNYAKRIAAENQLQINYVHANYLDFETDARFDLITMIFCDFCALSPEQRQALLVKFRDFLKPGGSVLLDVHSTVVFNQMKESATYERNQLDGFWSPNDYYCFVNRFKYADELVSLDKYTIVEETGSRVVYNWLQFYTKSSLRAEFHAAGFAIADIYADVEGKALAPDSPEMAIAALK